MALELLAEYCESLGSYLLEDAKGRGFIIYSVRPPHGRLKEAYVKPEYRRQGVGLAMCQLVGEIVKEQGCTHLYSSINLGQGGAMVSLLAHLHGGATVVEAKDNVLTMEWKIP